MTQSDPFEVSKAKVLPFRRSIKIAESASSGTGRVGVIQQSFRPKTWAMHGKRKTVITDGDREHTVIRFGGGPTKAGAAVGAAGITGAAVGAKKKGAVAKRDDPFELSKKGKGYMRRPPFQNTRGENTKAGAITGGAIYGGAGAALGAGVEASRARSGLRALKSVGAHPGKFRAAKLVASHASKTGAITGAVAGTVGAGLGAGLGAIQSPKGSKWGEQDRQDSIAHQKRKAAKANAKAAEFAKSAFGVEHLEKADRRMGGQAEWTGHLPKHTSGALAANKSAFLSGIEMPDNVRPVKPGLRVTRKLVRIPK